MSDLTHYSICKTLVSCYFVFLIPGLQHQSKMMFATHASLAFARADVFILLMSWFFRSFAGGLFSGLLRVWGKPRFVLTAQERDEFMTAHGIHTSAIFHFSICCCLCSFLSCNLQYCYIRLRPYPRPVLHWSLRIWRKPNCSTNSFANRSIWLIQLHAISSMAVINMNYLAPECSIVSCALTIFQDLCASFKVVGKLHKSYLGETQQLENMSHLFILFIT